MSTKQFFHNIDLLNVGQLIGARYQNVSDSEMATLAGSLNTSNTGLVVYNTDQNQQFNWNGSKFDPIQIDLAGDIIFKGVVDASAPSSTSIESQTNDVAGYQYIISTAGTIPTTLSYNGNVVAVVGDTNSDGVIDVDVGDVLLFVDETGAGADVDGTQSGRANKVYILQRNSEYANETAAGNIRLATQQEVNDGVVDDEAVTPSTLQGKLDSQFYVRQFITTVNLPALTPVTINHNLNLLNKESFTFNAMNDGSQISLDVDSINVNSITVTSFLPLTNVAITVQGASS